MNDGTQAKPARIFVGLNWLLELRRWENDLTLDAIAERLLRRHGLEADKSMLSRFFAGEGHQLQKNRAHQRAGSSRRR